MSDSDQVRQLFDTFEQSPFTGSPQVNSTPQELALRDPAGNPQPQGWLADGAIDVAAFAATIRPVILVHGLPTLPDTSYPVGQFVYNLDESPARLYKNEADAWVAAIGPDDIQANSITAGQIAAGAISTSELAVGARLTGEVANESGATPGVFIDSTGILIRDGKLTLQDEFGSTAMSASGFDGSWADFLAYGLYNGAFEGITTNPLSLGRTSLLPYWTVARDNDGVATYPAAPTYDGGGSASVSLTADSAYPAGVTTKHVWSALGENTYLISDPIPIVPGFQYPITAMVAFARVAGTLNIVSRAIFYDEDGSLLDDYPIFIVFATASANAAWISLGSLDEVSVPSHARSVKIVIHCYESGSHSSFNYIKVGAVSLGPGTSIAADLHVDGLQADAAVTANSTLTVVDTINALGDVIVASGGTLTASSVNLSGDTTNTSFSVDNDGTATYTSKTLTWNRIGAWVFFHLDFVVNAAGSGATAIAVSSTGLPSPAASTAFMGDHSGSGAQRLMVRFVDGGTEGQFSSFYHMSAPTTQLTGANLVATAHFSVTGVYRTADPF